MVERESTDLTYLWLVREIADHSVACSGSAVKTLISVSPVFGLKPSIGVIGRHRRNIIRTSRTRNITHFQKLSPTSRNI